MRVIPSKVPHVEWAQKDGFNHKVETQLQEHIELLGWLILRNDDEKVAILDDNDSKDSMVEVEFLNAASMTKLSTILFNPELFNSRPQLVITERRQEETATDKHMGCRPWCFVLWFLISCSHTTTLLILVCLLKFKISTVLTWTLVVVFVGTLPYNFDSLSNQT